MRLYVDLETLQLIEGPGFRNPVTLLHFKRGDAAQLEVAFLTGATTATHIGDPAALELQFGIKPRGRYDVGYLVHEAVWTMPDAGAEDPVYVCSPSFNTEELDSAMQVDSATGSELAEITLMGEITWREGGGEPTSTRTFKVVVENDVNRGTEGVPTDAEPAYPAAENIEMVTRKGAANGYAALDSTGKVPATQLNITADSISDSTLTGRELVRAASPEHGRIAIGGGAIGSLLFTAVTKRSAHQAIGLDTVSRVVDASGIEPQTPLYIFYDLLNNHLQASESQSAGLAILLGQNYFDGGHTVAHLVDVFLSAIATESVKQIRWLIIEKLDDGSGAVGDFRISNSAIVDVHWTGATHFLGPDDIVRLQILEATHNGGNGERAQVIAEYISSQPGGASSTSS